MSTELASPAEQRHWAWQERQLQRAKRILHERGLSPDHCSEAELLDALAAARRELVAGGDPEPQVPVAAHDDPGGERMHARALAILKMRGKESGYTQDEYLVACSTASAAEQQQGTKTEAQLRELKTQYVETRLESFKVLGRDMSSAELYIAAASEAGEAFDAYAVQLGWSA